MSKINRLANNTNEVQKIQAEWQGLSFVITYYPKWMPLKNSDFIMARLEIQSGSPETKLPITETGYRSHFLHPDEIAARGGVEKYVQGWFDYASQSPEWKKNQRINCQPSLFG